MGNPNVSRVSQFYVPVSIMAHLRGREHTVNEVLLVSVDSVGLPEKAVCILLDVELCLIKFETS